MERAGWTCKPFVEAGVLWLDRTSPLVYSHRRLGKSGSSLLTAQSTAGAQRCAGRLMPDPVSSSGSTSRACSRIACALGGTSSLLPQPFRQGKPTPLSGRVWFAGRCSRLRPSPRDTTSGRLGQGKGWAGERWSQGLPLLRQSGHGETRVGAGSVWKHTGQGIVSRGTPRRTGSPC